MKRIRVKTYGNGHAALSKLALVIKNWARVDQVRHVSLESQQLQAVGMMPSSDVAVVDLRTIRQSDLARLIATADDPGQAHDLIVLKPDDETTMQRAEREDLEKVLRDNGFQVFNTPEAMAEYAEQNINKFPDEEGGLTGGTTKVSGGNVSSESFENGGIMTYRKKPVAVEAFHWFEGAIPSGWMAEAIESGKAIIATEKRPNGVTEMRIETLEGWITASVGDYIIRGVKGELYPCKPDIFHMTYEAV